MEPLPLSTIIHTTIQSPSLKSYGNVWAWLHRLYHDPDGARARRSAQLQAHRPKTPVPLLRAIFPPKHSMFMNGTRIHSQTVGQKLRVYDEYCRASAGASGASAGPSGPSGTGPAGAGAIARGPIARVEPAHLDRMLDLMLEPARVRRPISFFSTMPKPPTSTVHGFLVSHRHRQHQVTAVARILHDIRAAGLPVSRPEQNRFLYMSFYRDRPEVGARVERAFAQVQARKGRGSGRLDLARDNSASDGPGDASGPGFGPSVDLGPPFTMAVCDKVWRTDPDTLNTILELSWLHGAEDVFARAVSALTGSEATGASTASGSSGATGANSSASGASGASGANSSASGANFSTTGTNSSATGANSSTTSANSSTTGANSSAVGTSFGTGRLTASGAGRKTLHLLLSAYSHGPFTNPPKFRSLARQTQAQPGLDIALINTIIAGHLRLGNIAEAETILTNLPQNIRTPIVNRETYAKYLFFYDVLAQHVSVPPMALAPTVETFTPFLRYYAGANQYHDMFRILSTIQAHGLPWTTKTFRVCLDGAPPEVNCRLVGMVVESFERGYSFDEDVTSASGRKANGAGTKSTTTGPEASASGPGAGSNFETGSNYQTDPDGTIPTTIGTTTGTSPRTSPSASTGPGSVKLTDELIHKISSNFNDPHVSAEYQHLKNQISMIRKNSNPRDLHVNNQVTALKYEYLKVLAGTSQS